MGLSRENRDNQTEWDLHESEELVPLEFTEENAVSLVGVDENVQQTALEGLKITLMERKVLDAEFDTVSVLEVNAENVPKFKALRLKYVKNRTQGIDKWHERESETALKYKQFLDAKKRAELAINASREEKLLEGEKFFENQEKEKKRLLNLERLEKIKPYVSETTGLDFSEMNDYDFDDYVLGKKTRFENEAKAKKDADELAEKNRLAEVERQKKIAIENAKLKKEAEEKEKALQKERAEAKAKADKLQAENDAKLKAEKAKSDKIALELKLKNEAEAKAEKERLAKIEAEKADADKLAKAPIKKQLSVWVSGFELPKTEVNNETAKEIIAKFEAFKKWSLTQVNNL